MRGCVILAQMGRTTDVQYFGPSVRPAPVHRPSVRRSSSHVSAAAPPPPACGLQRHPTRFHLKLSSLFSFFFPSLARVSYGISLVISLSSFQPFRASSRVFLVTSMTTTERIFEGLFCSSRSSIFSVSRLETTSYFGRFR